MPIKSDSRPLYLQVIERIKKDIANDVYEENEKLPSEFELAKQLGVSRATLREALRILEEENVIMRKHGVGTFVKSRPLFSSGIEQLNSVTAMIRQANMVPGTIYLNSTTVSPQKEDLKLFSCSKDDKLLKIERIRTANGEPVVYCVDKIPQKVLLTPFTYENESIFSTIETVANRRITYAITEIEPLGFDPKVSPLLNCGKSCAILILTQMHYDESDEPILFSTNYFKADMFKFHVLRSRD